MDAELPGSHPDTAPAPTLVAGWRTAWLPPSGGGRRAWGFALLAGLLGIALRAAMQPLLGDHLPFVVAYPIITLAALAWGTWPGMLTAAVCAAAVALHGLPPSAAGTELPVQLGAFIIASIAICLCCGALGRRGALRFADTAHADTPLTLWLRAVLWGAVLIPLAAFVLASWWGYERALRDAEESVGHASALALGHAERTLAIAQDIAARSDSITSAADTEVRANEAQLHQRLADLVAGLPSIVNLNVWDAEGRPLVRSDLFPVDSQAFVGDRDYFRAQREAAQRKGSARMGLSEVLTGRQTGVPLFNATLPRSAPDGSFRGIVAVSLTPEFFQDYYRSLAADEPLMASFALIHTDGTLLARWPAVTGGQRPLAIGSAMLRRVQAGETSGIVMLAANEGREARLVSFRRVQGYPAYLVAGVSRAGVLSGWYRFVALLAASLLPVTVGLVTVSWVALKKTRREQAVSAELQEQIERRSTVERAMVESQKLATLAQLTGGVAHDFNNLLAILSNNLHVHRRTHPQLTGERPLLAMERAVRSGMRLTRQLLSFSRRQALNPEVIRLQDWLPATADLLRTTLNRSIELDFVVADDTAAIHADAAELELALINTALNAQHAMAGGGKLQIVAGNVLSVRAVTQPQPAGAAPPEQLVQPMVLISVRDNGVGIAPEALRRVFEPFFTTRAAGTGSGLGLTQVNGLCTQAGGFATIDSTPGAGTSINLHFPAVGSTPAAPGAEAPAPAAVLRGTVLLVEDNDDVASATETLLRTAGLQVIRAANAEKALAHLTRGGLTPDVVLSDISMPGEMDGIALAFALRERRPGLPVLLTTGYAERLHDAVVGGFQVLAKPAPPDQVLGAVAAVLARVAAQGPAAGASGSAASMQT